LPSEISKVCAAVYAEKKSSDLSLVGSHASDNSKSIYSDHRERLANELICGAMGREAAASNWILSLHDFARANGRLPSQYEINKCKQSALEFDQEFDGILRGENERGRIPFAVVLERLGDGMLRRRARLAAMVNGR
jgi:hypothetical protein